MREMKEMAPEITKAQAALDPTKKDNKPVINITDQPMYKLSDLAWEALKMNNEPPKFFVRNWAMTEIRVDTKGQAKLREMSESALRGKLDRTAYWVRWKRKGEGFEEVPTQPPTYVVRDMLVESHMPLPPIQGITYTPVFSRDGVLKTKPGHHEHTELFYIQTSQKSISAISKAPTDVEVKKATDVLMNEVLVDFPFKDRASRVHALAAMLLPFCRLMIRGPVPIYLIDAPKIGTGKSLLARVIHVIVTGMDASMDRLPKTDEETDKKIVSILRDGRPIVVLDNVSGSIERDSLNAMLTSTRYSGRLLGKSEMVEFANMTTWIMTGNNVDLVGDIHRRICWIRLDAKIDKPYMRDNRHFQHDDLIGWTQDNRELCIWSLLTLIQNWIAKGKPNGESCLSSFERWSYTIGGILKAAGLAGFLGNQKELLEVADQDGLVWGALLNKWWNEYRDTFVLSHHIWELAARYDMLYSVLGGGNERSQKIKLGKELQKQRDLVYENFCICAKRDNHRKVMIYWLKQMDQ